MFMRIARPNQNSSGTKRPVTISKNFVWGTLSLLLIVGGCKPKSDNPPGSTNTAVAPSDNPGSSAVAPPVAPDNSARNIVDRNDATLTPGDQGESATDRDLTQKVRKGIVVGPGDYSMTAKNIKIITVNGKVTLRGPVKTDAEKLAIVALAKAVAGEANVDDQLEVKANP